MQSLKHLLQKKLWNEEHKNPRILLPMQEQKPSHGVTEFWTWLQDHTDASKRLTGIEMGCGKGRNSIWLADQGADMHAFDFSSVAIEVAKARRPRPPVPKKRAGDANVRFIVHDATEPWPYPDRMFDFAIDCFAMSDIESEQGRAFARQQFRRVLKKGGHLFVYAISSESPFHRKMIDAFPGPNRNTFYHPGGKFEKVYDEVELREFYSEFDILELKRVKASGSVTFYKKEYESENFWMVMC